MKKSIAIVLVIAAIVVAYVQFSVDKENTDIKHVLRDTGITESTALEEGPQDVSASNNNQKTQNEPTQSYKGQQLEPEIEKAVNELVNTSHEGLVEVKTDQGVSVDLKGRFRTAPVATINEKGELIVQDYTSAPGR